MKYLAFWFLTLNTFAFINCSIIDHPTYSEISVIDETSFFLVAAKRRDTSERDDITYFGELEFDQTGFYAKKEQSWECETEATCKFFETISHVENELKYVKYLEIGSDITSETILGTDCIQQKNARR